MPSSWAPSDSNTEARAFASTPSGSVPGTIAAKIALMLRQTGQPAPDPAQHRNPRRASVIAVYELNGGGLFRVSVPDNWREVATSASVKFAPDGAYGQVQSQTVFTHGVELGFTRNEVHSLQEATQEFIDGLAQSNPSLRATGGLQNANLSGRNGLVVTLNNVSEVTGRGETVTVFTTLRRDGNLFYCIAVAPRDEYQAYQRSFQHVAQSISLSARATAFRGGPVARIREHGPVSEGFTVRLMSSQPTVNRRPKDGRRCA
jgi:hypothetical protein